MNFNIGISSYLSSLISSSMCIDFLILLSDTSFGYFFLILLSDTTFNGFHLQIFDLTRLRGLSENINRRFTADALYTGVSNAHNLAVNTETNSIFIIGASRDGRNINTCNGKECPRVMVLRERLKRC